MVARKKGAGLDLNMTYFGLEDDALNDNPTEEKFGVKMIPEGSDEIYGGYHLMDFNFPMGLMKKILGPSLGPSGDGKVTEEWHFTTKYGPVTLYDYKGHCFSIGGIDKLAAQDLIRYLNYMIKKKEKE